MDRIVILNNMGEKPTPIRPGVDKQPPVRQPVQTVREDEVAKKRESKRPSDFYRPGI